VAVEDPHVIAIKMTLYRIGPNSPLIPLLIAAAEAGKQVAVLVELKARFDERTTSPGRGGWSRTAFTSCTALPISRRTRSCAWSCARRPTAFSATFTPSTGNYNPETAKVYTDLGLFTADPESSPTCRTSSIT
jgi:polyphosphate kinase